MLDSMSEKDISVRVHSWAFRYKSDLDMIELSYKCAMDGVERARVDHRKRKGAMIREVEASLSNEDFEAFEHLIYQTQVELQEEEDDEMHSITKHINESFIVTLNLFWEKSLIKITNVKRPVANDFIKTHLELGLAPEIFSLLEYRLIANVIKHSSGPSAGELLLISPSRFFFARKPSYDSLEISSADVLMYIDVLKGSGPPGGVHWLGKKATSSLTL